MTKIYTYFNKDLTLGDRQWRVGTPVSLNILPSTQVPKYWPSPPLAVLLSPEFIDDTMVMFECELAARHLTIVRAVRVPPLYSNSDRISFALLCILQVDLNPVPWFAPWADNWINGVDREQYSAMEVLGELCAERIFLGIPKNINEAMKRACKAVAYFCQGGERDTRVPKAAAAISNLVLTNYNTALTGLKHAR